MTSRNSWLCLGFDSQSDQTGQVSSVSSVSSVSPSCNASGHIVLSGRLMGTWWNKHRKHAVRSRTSRRGDVAARWFAFQLRRSGEIAFPGAHDKLLPFSPTPPRHDDVIKVSWRQTVSRDLIGRQLSHLPEVRAAIGVPDWLMVVTWTPADDHWLNVSALGSVYVWAIVG